MRARDRRAAVRRARERAHQALEASAETKRPETERTNDTLLPVPRRELIPHFRGPRVPHLQLDEELLSLARRNHDLVDAPGTKE
jgi:hypothetical protein